MVSQLHCSVCSNAITMVSQLYGFELRGVGQICPVPSTQSNTAVTPCNAPLARRSTTLVVEHALFVPAHLR